MQMSLKYYWEINLPPNMVMRLIAHVIASAAENTFIKCFSQFGPWQYRNKTQKVIFLLTVSLWKSCPFYTSFILHSTVLPLFCYCYSNYVCPLFLMFKPKFQTSWNSGLKARKTILVYLSPQHVARTVMWWPNSALFITYVLKYIYYLSI